MSEITQHRADFAPVAIFAYRRPRHVERLIDSLLANELFARSPVFVFCDGAREPQDRDAVAQTRNVVRERLGAGAEIRESATNQGLARSIIAGVSELCSRFGQVIVLEDDLLLHDRCLEFLNAALQRYADDDRVYHVNAYRYPLPAAAAPSFSRLASSWGWATWERAWRDFEPDASRLTQRLQEVRLAKALDFDGAFPYYAMLQAQAKGQIDSWAIRWYASVLLKGGLAIYPSASQVSNRGFDSTGEHCGESSSYDVQLGASSLAWPAAVSEDPVAYRQMQRFFRSMQGTLPRRVLRGLKRVLWAS